MAGTLLGTAQAFVEQTADEPCFRIHVRPSFLAYAVDWLVAGVEGVRAGDALRREWRARPTVVANSALHERRRRWPTSAPVMKS